jgi:hypothetical protein
MNISKHKAIRIVLLLFCVSMLVLGLAYIWHYVPASDWLGVTPPENMASEEGWYAYNEITGWSLCFIAVVNLSFLGFAGSKISSTSKLLFAFSIALFISVLTAAVAAEFLDNLLIKSYGI